MRVNELIEKLSGVNPDAFVNIYFDSSSYQNIFESSEYTNNRCITLTIKDIEVPFGDSSAYTFIKCEYKRYIPESQKHDNYNEYWK